MLQIFNSQDALWIFLPQTLSSSQDFTTFAERRQTLKFRCRFCQHFKRNFFIQKCFAQLFSNYSLALNFSGKRILGQKLHVNVYEIDFRSEKFTKIFFFFVQKIFTQIYCTNSLCLQFLSPWFKWLFLSCSVNCMS